MSKIDETLKKIAAGIPSGKTEDSEPDLSENIHDLPGDPTCLVCGGLGYLRLDLPVGHPEFGKLQICTCRHGQVTRQIRDRLFSMSNLRELGHLTFENFKPRGRRGLSPFQADSLEIAFKNSEYFAQHMKGWLLLQGGYGCGKTHLAAAIANFAVSMGVPTLFITVPDLLDSLRYAYGPADYSFEERFEEIRRSPLLVLDDFGTQNATAWAQEKLFQILNYRYINNLPLVVTTNLHPDDVEGRIRSRLLDPELVTRIKIQATDYRNPADDAGHPPLSSLGLMSGYNFQNFTLRHGENLKKEEIKSLENAFRAAKAYSEKPDGWLVFIGPPGCGKTHLAAAIANHQADLGTQTLFVLVPDLMDHLRATFSPNSPVSLDRRFDEVRTSPLLILDDIGTGSMTPWVKEKLYQLINYRYITELPTVFTTADYKDSVDARLLSRVEDDRLTEKYVINVPSFRGEASSKGRRRKRKN
jgi:DNA replication protein DnaC